jgi:hypothetical protein
MQLPHGTLTSSHKGAADLKELGETLARDGLTGYLRVSVFDKSAVRECVIVYLGGRPVMSFASDGTTDHKDLDYRHMEEAIRKEQAIVEVCQLQDKQVKLIQDVYREYALVTAAALQAAPAKPVAKEPPRVAVTPGHEEKARPATAPEIRGRFVRAENIGNLDEYLQKHPGETGHLLFMAQLDGGQEEQHILLIKGRIEAAYNDRASGQELLEKLKGVPGQTEFYTVSETLLASICGRYARNVNQQAEKERPAQGIGISTRELLEAARPLASFARDDINRAVGEISGGMDDDIALIRRVEHDFAGHVDELLSKLELSHLRSRKKL